MTHPAPTAATRSRAKLLLTGAVFAVAAACAASDGAVAPTPAVLVGDVSIDCPGVQFVSVAPANLWLPEDTTLIDTLDVVLDNPRKYVCAATVRAPAAGTTSVNLKVIRSTTDTVRVEVRASTNGWGIVTAAVNDVRVAGVSLFVTPRHFADVAIGHRGAGGAWPENTMRAFSAAMAAHLAGAEMDVRVSKDSVPIIMHDATVDRTTDGTGRVQDLTLAQLEALDDGAKFSPSTAGERIPTLAQVLEATKAANQRLVLDIKRDQGVLSDSAFAVMVVSMVQSYGAEGRVMLLSTSNKFMQVARKLSPTVEITLFDWGYKPQHRVFARGIHANLMHHPDSLLLPSMQAVYDSLATDGILVYSSTASDAAKIEKLLRLTPVRGIVTDIPPRALMQSRFNLQFPP